MNISPAMMTKEVNDLMREMGEAYREEFVRKFNERTVSIAEELRYELAGKVAGSLKTYIQRRMDTDSIEITFRIESGK